MVSGLDLQGGFAVAAARDIAVTALLSAFGTIVFRNLVAPDALQRMPQDYAEGLKRRWLWLAQASVAAGLLGSLAWLVVQASTMADAESITEAFAAVPTVLLKTSFGHVIAGQLAAMLMLGLVLGLRDTVWRQRTALGVATLAIALQAGHSHAASMYRGPSLLLGCDILHLLGAGAWLGGLLPLWLAVRDAPPNAGALAARRFSPLGQWCIAALVVSAAFQGFTLVTSIAGLVGTAYGVMVLVKLALFGVLLGFAAANRYRFAPDLLRDDPAAARQVLLRSIGVQTGFALAIVIAAVDALAARLAVRRAFQPRDDQRGSGFPARGDRSRAGVGRRRGAGAGVRDRAPAARGVGDRGRGDRLVRCAAFFPAAGGGQPL
jgi:putative copper resistance protein D